jgi:hypothetical protein
VKTKYSVNLSKAKVGGFFPSEEALHMTITGNAKAIKDLWDTRVTKHPEEGTNDLQTYLSKLPESPFTLTAYNTLPSYLSEMQGPGHGVAAALGSYYACLQKDGRNKQICIAAYPTRTTEAGTRAGAGASSAALLGSEVR